MARRIDYHHDPAAPSATSIVPSVNVAVTNDAGELLLVRRSDNGNWALPGGGVDLGESLTQAAVRETRQEFSIVLTARPTGGVPAPSSETSDVRWVALATAGSLQMDPSMRQRVEHVTGHRDRPYLG